MNLEDEYLLLLRSHGLERVTDKRSVGEMLADLERLAESATNEARRRRAKEVIAVIKTLDQETGGAVSMHLGRTGADARNRPLDDYVAVVTEAMALKGVGPPENVYFNVFPTGEFNAVARPAGGGYLCLLNTGLLRLLSNVAHAACFPVRVSDDQILLDEKGAEDEEISSLEVTLAAAVKVILNYLRYEMHAYPMPTNRRLSPWGAIHATALARAMKTFALAHEVGHVVLDHCSSRCTRTVVVPTGELEVTSKSHRDEFDADLWAQNLLLMSDAVDLKRIPMAVGGIAFLTVHLMVLHVCCKLRGQPFHLDQPTESHPPSTFRLSRLRSVLEQTLAREQLERVLTLWALLARVLELIKLSDIQVSDEQVSIHLRGSP